MSKKENIKQSVSTFFSGDELATNVFINKYSWNGEETPQETFHRLINAVYNVESKYLDSLNDRKVDTSKVSARGKERYENNTGGYVLDRLMNLIYGFDRLILAGSVMSVLGTDTIASLSNCIVNRSPEDTIDGINK